MVGNQDLLGDRRKQVKELSISPLTYEKGFDALFNFISIKLHLMTQLGIKAHNIGELKAWLDILDMLVTLSARVGYNDKHVCMADHAFYNHKEKMEELHKLVKENYVP